MPAELKIQMQNVLIIDHSDTALAVIAKLIKQYISHVAVDTVNSFAEALQQLQINHYDLITMSLNLPDIECRDMVEKIRNELKDRNTPLIVVSGEKNGIMDDQLACQYVNGYFNKKLGQKKLVSYIRSFLNIETPRPHISGNILYVEDNSADAQSIKNILTAHGHNYLLARDAESALHNIQQSFSSNHIQPFDLLLINNQLSGYMSSRDLIRKIRHNMALCYEQLPILVSVNCSYEEDPGEINQILSVGANDILVKSTHEALLNARIHTLLSLRNQYVQLNQSDLAAASL